MGEKRISLEEINLALSSLLAKDEQETGYTLQLIQGAIAELETLRTNCREKIKEGQEKAIKEGRFPGGERYGLKRNKEGKFIQDQKEQDIIAEIQVLRAKGMSYKAVADELNNRFIQTKKQKKWYMSTVWYILNKKYTKKGQDKDGVLKVEN